MKQTGSQVLPPGSQTLRGWQSLTATRAGTAQVEPAKAVKPKG